MSVIKYIGRTTDFKGKSLWEICGNLKNFGVGRVVVRSRFERYPEKSFFRILQVETLPNEENRKIKVLAEKVFRGMKYEKPILIESASYKTDYRLLSKKEEASYCQVLCTQEEKVKLIAPEMDLPPLLKEFVVKEGGTENPKMKVYLKKGHNKNHRLAREGEKPDVVVPIDLGAPLSPSLFEGLEMKNIGSAAVLE